MPKIGMNDIVLNKILTINSKASKKITQKLKGDKPFASEKLDPDLFLWAVNNVGVEDIQELRQEFGDDAVGKLRFEAWKIEQGRQK